MLARRPDVELRVATDGEAGLELVRDCSPSLVLLDLHLPKIGGQDVLSRLRSDPATADVPVLVVTADASQGNAERLLALGATG